MGASSGHLREGLCRVRRSGSSLFMTNSLCTNDDGKETQTRLSEVLGCSALPKGLGIWVVAEHFDISRSHYFGKGTNHGQDAFRCRFSWLLWASYIGICSCCKGAPVALASPVQISKLAWILHDIYKHSKEWKRQIKNMKPIHKHIHITYISQYRSKCVQLYVCIYI